MRKKEKLLLLKVVLMLLIAFSVFGIKEVWRTSCRQVATTENEWNLRLVNQHNYIPEDYELEFADLSNGKKVDKRIYEQLREMLTAAEKEGIYMVVVEAYRTEEEQQQLLDEKIDEYVQKGFPDFLAKIFAKKWVAVPGTSEHQLGIAVDINPDYSQSGRDEVYNWLAENGYQYGFIYRYPEDKIHITGICNEPWHYRYVGVEAATEMHEQDICLEEYLEE